MPYKFRPGVVHIEDNLGNSTNIMGLLSDSNGTSSNCNCGSISNSYIMQRNTMKKSMASLPSTGSGSTTGQGTGNSNNSTGFGFK